MSNPYESPVLHQEERNAKAIVQGPAIALIVVSSIAILLGLLALGLDIVLIAVGAIERLEAMNEGAISEYTQIAIRSIWGVVLIIASSFVLYGAIHMRNLKKYEIARAATIVAMVPLLGPCCIVGIPFGIWAFMALGKPGVRNAFR
jgi:hypothetical protein